MPEPPNQGSGSLKITDRLTTPVLNYEEFRAKYNKKIMVATVISMTFLEAWKLPFYNCINVDVKVLHYHEMFLFFSPQESK